MSNYKTDPANIYYNANFVNTTSQAITAEYNSYRNTVIVSSPREYYMKIENFVISDLLLPIMTLLPNSLSVTIDATSTGGSVAREYLPIINNSSASSASGRIYNIEIFVEMVNIGLRAAHIASGALGNTPVLYYDGNGIFSFIIDYVYFTNGTELWFNTLLGQKLSSFVLYFNSYNNNDILSDGRVFRLTYYPSATNRFSQFPPASQNPSAPYLYPLIKVDQPYVSTFLLSDVQRLVVTTSQMPTLREYITGLPNQNINVTLGILFSVPVNGSFNVKSERIEYRPAQQRFIDLVSQEPLNIIDYKISYQTTDGRLNDIRIEPGQSFGITFAFVHKSIADNAYTFNKLDL